MYSNISFWKFVLAATVLSAPLIILPGKWQYAYVLLILLAFVVANRGGFVRFTSFLTGELR